MAENRVTQIVVETVHGGSAHIHHTQEVIEAIHGASSFIWESQLVIEVVKKVSLAGIARVSGAGNVISQGRMGCQCVRKISGVCEHSTDVPEVEIVGTPTTWSACIDGFPIECT